MGWEMRTGKRVYYRKEWVTDPEARGGGRVRSVYCGSGERGEAAAGEDEERSAARVMSPEKAVESPASEAQNAPPMTFQVLPPAPTARAPPAEALAHAPAGPVTTVLLFPAENTAFCPSGDPSRLRQLLLENELRRLRGR